MLEIQTLTVQQLNVVNIFCKNNWRLGGGVLSNRKMPKTIQWPLRKWCHLLPDHHVLHSGLLVSTSTSESFLLLRTCTGTSERWSRDHRFSLGVSRPLEHETQSGNLLALQQQSVVAVKTWEVGGLGREPQLQSSKTDLWGCRVQLLCVWPWYKNPHDHCSEVLILMVWFRQAQSLVDRRSLGYREKSD